MPPGCERRTDFGRRPSADATDIAALHDAVAFGLLGIFKDDTLGPSLDGEGGSLDGKLAAMETTTGLIADGVGSLPLGEGRSGFRRYIDNCTSSERRAPV